MSVVDVIASAARSLFRPAWLLDDRPRRAEARPCRGYPACRYPACMVAEPGCWPWPDDNDTPSDLSRELRWR